MGKKGRNQNKDSINLKKRSTNEYVDPKDMDDEIDAFHKQRDVIPLDVVGVGEFSDDEEEPVFDDKVKVCGDMKGGAVRYIEVKQLRLLTYCQAITFCLVLKTEGHSVHDHPVVACLVEIKELFDKMKPLDGNLPPELEELLKEDQESEMMKHPPVEEKNLPALPTNLARKGHVPFLKPCDQQKEEKGTNELTKSEPHKDGSSKEDKRKRKNGVFCSFAVKSNKERKHSKLVNRPFETFDDFNDDAISVKNGTLGSKIQSQLVPAKQNTPKGVSLGTYMLCLYISASESNSTFCNHVISGDDDLPKRDGIGERRMKFEMGALARTGVTFEDAAGNELDDEHVDEASDTDEDGDEEEDGNSGDSGDEFYKQVEQQRAAKRAAKAQIYTRIQAVPSLPETVDGKPKINYQIEKNKGLTPSRPKSAKNPRKKYREKHKKQQQRRKGQAREVRKPAGPYAGEASGINPGISKSIRFKN
ncbi:hypothetical protein Tsubulata_034463 [Turnera subulata]|uniref:Sas10 C-terminal domain-containing protein n=1 Tax=Turnera subulata TaxID=218843 RepID=A0A9Q0FC78_9ROSI|nr:hypothetical protein Tsubulata_034463 [Turnera subulata]